MYSILHALKDLQDFTREVSKEFWYCSFGALLGKVTPTQILWLLVLEVPIYAVNAKLADRLGALDVGGSITIHTFGAFYGLAASKVVGFSPHM